MRVPSCLHDQAHVSVLMLLVCTSGAFPIATRLTPVQQT